MMLKSTMQVSIPYRLATNLRYLKTVQQRIGVSIPYRLATNKYEMHINEDPEEVSIPYRLATNMEYPKNNQQVKMRFNPL